MSTKQDELVAAVQSTLVPALRTRGIKVVGEEKEESADYVAISLEAGVLRIRVLRDRGQVFVDFGSVKKPAVWFDSAVVIDYFGLARDGGFHSRDVSEVVTGLVRFLEATWEELTKKFEGDNFPRTERELTALRDARAGSRLRF